MISKFKIKNFKSINELTVDLSYDEKKAPNGYKNSNNLYFIERNKKKFVPVLAFYGANASGKSNIIEAFYTFEAITGIGDKKVQDYFFKNKLNDICDATTFEMEFFYNKIKLNYEIEYGDDGVKKEILKVDDKILYSITNKKTDFSNIAIKDICDESFLNEFYKIRCVNPKGQQVNSFASILKDILDKFPSLNTYLAFFTLMVQKGMTCNYNNDIDFSLFLFLMDNSPNEWKVSHDEISKWIKKFDFDIESIDIIRPDNDYDSYLKKMHEDIKKDKANINDIVKNVLIKSSNNLTVDTYHKDINGKLIKFGIKEESLGTRRLFGLIGMILHILKSGGSLIIDEFDCSIHPLILREIVKMFKSKEINKNQAQLIFTTHNTDLLDDNLLRVSEVAILNKNLKKGTTLKRVSEFKEDGIRNVTNFRKRYLNGEFRGIPYAYI